MPSLSCWRCSSQSVFARDSGQPTRFGYFFFFNDPATTEIYTLSLHDALPIWWWATGRGPGRCRRPPGRCGWATRSEEHTSELQSHVNLVCRLLLEKKKKTALFIKESDKLSC